MSDQQDKNRKRARNLDFGVLTFIFSIIPIGLFILIFPLYYIFPVIDFYVNVIFLIASLVFSIVGITLAITSRSRKNTNKTFLAIGILVSATIGFISLTIIFCSTVYIILGYLGVYLPGFM